MNRSIPLIVTLAAVITSSGIVAPAMAAEHPETNAGTSAQTQMMNNSRMRSSETYICEDLSGIDDKYVGSVVYYVKGHYDAKHDIWTDYGANSDTETMMVDDVYLPVPEIVAYCKANPKETVASAIERTHTKGMMK